MPANPLSSLCGPFYFGTVMSTTFYGVTCMQTFFYYVNYQDDPLRIKIFVAIMWALDTIHEALSVANAYKFIMAGLVNSLSFTPEASELVLLLLFTTLVALPAQGFFVHRIYAFSGKNIVGPFIWVVLALAQLVGAAIYTCKALYSADGRVHVVEISALSTGLFMILGTLHLSVAAGADILIAIFMTFLLVRERSFAGFARTAHILQLLTVFAVNTGIWTATFALLTLILVHLFPTKALYAVFIIPLCPVYCNTVLANLNVRVYVRGEATYNVGVDLFASSSSRMSNSTKGNKRLGETKMIFAVPETRTTELVTLPDANQSITAAVENS